MAKKSKRPPEEDEEMDDVGADWGLDISAPDDLPPGETNAVIYGAPGCGKTGLVCTAPAPLILDFENGAATTVRAMRDLGYTKVRVLKVTDMDEVRKAFEMLQSGNHPFKSVSIDPMGELQRMALEEVVGKYKSKRQYDDLPSMADWNKALSNLTKTITAFRGLPMHCIVVAHSTMPEHEEDSVKPLVSGKNFGPFLQGAMDLLGYLHVEEDGDGESVRRLVTRPTATIRAKNRGNKLPPVVEEPNLTDIFAVMES